LEATQSQNLAKANKISKKPSTEDENKTNFFLLDNTSKMIENIPDAYKPIDSMDEEAADFAQKSGNLEEIKVIN
jgi:RNA-splicing ligase RtcB